MVSLSVLEIRSYDETAEPTCNIQVLALKHCSGVVQETESRYPYWHWRSWGLQSNHCIRWHGQPMGIQEDIHNTFFMQNILRRASLRVHRGILALSVDYQTVDHVSSVTQQSFPCTEALCQVDYS